MSMNNTINWINNEIMRAEIYHNHKENMSWVATALYITGAITLPILLSNIKSSYVGIIATILFIFVTAATFIFIHWQFKNRWTASGWVRGLILTAENLLSEGTTQLDWSVEGKNHYPKFIMNNVPTKQWHTIDRIQSEFVSYFIMTIAFGISIAMLLRLN